jgi:hypothetical protein
MADIPNERVLQQTEPLLTFRVEDVDGHGTNADKLPGILRPQVAWSYQRR